MFPETLLTLDATHKLHALKTPRHTQTGTIADTQTQTDIHTHAFLLTKSGGQSPKAVHLRRGHPCRKRIDPILHRSL